MKHRILINGFKAPDTLLAQEAADIVAQLHSPAILNHVHRTWWFAETIGLRRGLKYDRELVYLASLLHDLGLTPEYEKASRFEVDGADAAHQFLRARNYPEDKAALVWDAIALHTSGGLADRKQPEVALIYLGAGADVLGAGLELLTPSVVDEILENFPRVGFKKAFQEALAGIVRRKPYTAPTLKGLVDIGQRHVHGFSCANFCDLMDSAPFES